MLEKVQDWRQSHVISLHCYVHGFTCQASAAVHSFITSPSLQSHVHTSKQSPSTNCLSFQLPSCLQIPRESVIKCGENKGREEGTKGENGTALIEERGVTLKYNFTSPDPLQMSR